MKRMILLAVLACRQRVGTTSNRLQAKRAEHSECALPLHLSR